MIKRLLAKFLLRCYIGISLIASVGVSTGVFNLTSAVMYRAPFLIVEVSRCTPNEIREDGKSFGYDQKDKYLAYDTEDFGKDFISICIWNPLNNYEDDVLVRIDYEL